MYLICDTKLGDRSPIWILSAPHFHLLGRTLAGSMGWYPPQLPIQLDEKATFIMERIAPERYRWSLGFRPSFTFSLGEITAFCWGYRHGQFPPDGPLRDLTYVGPPTVPLAYM